VSYVIAILGLGLVCGLWVIVQQVLGGEKQPKGCGRCETPGPDCEGKGDCDEG
jgi:hypothetical protein